MTKRYKHSPEWEPKRVTLVCLQCKKKYSLMPSIARNRKGKFCSRTCMYRYQKLQRTTNGTSNCKR